MIVLQGLWRSELEMYREQDSVHHGTNMKSNEVRTDPSLETPIFRYFTAAMQMNLLLLHLCVRTRKSLRDSDKFAQLIGKSSQYLKLDILDVAESAEVRTNYVQTLDSCRLWYRVVFVDMNFEVAIF